MVFIFPVMSASSNAPACVRAQAETVGVASVTRALCRRVTRRIVAFCWRGRRRRLRPLLGGGAKAVAPWRRSAAMLAVGIVERRRAARPRWLPGARRPRRPYLGTWPKAVARRAARPSMSARRAPKIRRLSRMARMAGCERGATRGNGDAGAIKKPRFNATCDD